MSFILDRLNPLRGEVIERKFATIDIEAYKWVNPYAVGFYDGIEYHDFIGPDCIRESLAFVLQPKYTGYWIYAHNGGNYDFLFFLRELAKRSYFKYRIDITPIQSSIIRIDVGEIDEKDEPRKDGKMRVKKHWAFLDSAKLMPIKLDDVGETFGIGKKVKLNMSYDELAKPENRELMRRYLKQDCFLLHKALIKMQTEVNKLGGQVSVTLPSTALDIFRRRFLKTEVYTNRHLPGCQDAEEEHAEQERKRTRRESLRREKDSHDGRELRLQGREQGVQSGNLRRPVSDRRVSSRSGKPRSNSKGMRTDVARNDGAPGGVQLQRCNGCLHDFIRFAYYGGRTEIYRMKFKSIAGQLAKMYDINSHYPHCMLDAMPVGIASYLDGGDQDEAFVYQAAKRSIGMVECDVSIPRDCYLPPLPYRHGGKLIFPVGNFRGTWDCAELGLLPLVGGRITKVYRSVWFEGRPIFSRFITELYKYRDKKSKTYNEGMSWIAKILMNSAYGKFAMKEDRMRIIMRPKSPEGLYAIDVDSDVWGEKVKLKPNYVVPQLSVHVTALARARLWEAMQNALSMGGKIYYCDTDSIVCSGITLPTSTELGGLKLEDGQIKRAEFVLPKLYLIESGMVNEDKKREKQLKIKAKGMGPGIREGTDDLDGQLAEKEFLELVSKGAPIMRERITKLKEGLNAYARQSLDFPRVIASPKALRTVYDKRKVLDDYDTVPIVLDRVL